MLVLGLPNLPTPQMMSGLNERLQKLCGVQSLQYKGAFGNMYYVNDMAAIIAEVCVLAFHYHL